MIQVWRVTLALVLLNGALAAWSAEDAAARALVDKALAAHGGANLERLSATTVKFKGTFHGMGMALEMTGEIATHGRERQKVEALVDVGGQKLRIVHVLNGAKGWTRIAGDTKELNAKEVAEAREQAYAEWIVTLAPLKDRALSLASIGEVEIDKRPALGIRVSSKGHRDVLLFFDKATSRLAKSETRLRDDDDQEVTQEAFVSDYKDVQGTRQATKFTIKRDGKLFMEGEVTACELAEQLDESVFARP